MKQIRVAANQYKGVEGDGDATAKRILVNVFTWDNGRDIYHCPGGLSAARV
jgi:hypothetical protein